MGRLIDNLESVTFAVIDFEYTTPAGAPPEPIEVAVATLRAERGVLRRGWTYDALIRPPAHAPVTAFDTWQTGIRPEMLTDRPDAATVLAELDEQLDRHLGAGTPDGRCVLVAQHAHAEARILHDHRAHCPRLARTDLLDTVRLARDLYPDLPGHRLDDLTRHLGIPAAPGRHRAMPDVALTAAVFEALLAAEVRWPDLRTLRAVAGVPARAADAEQDALF